MQRPSFIHRTSFAFEIETGAKIKSARSSRAYRQIIGSRASVLRLFPFTALLNSNCSVCPEYRIISIPLFLSSTISVAVALHSCKVRTMTRLRTLIYSFRFLEE
jgi:hypothetical protein